MHGKLILFTALVAMQAAHSLEEYFTGFYVLLSDIISSIHENIGFFPVIRISGLTFIIINLALITFQILLVPFFGKQRWATITAIIVAFIEIFNGLTHICATILLGGYFSGSFTATGLVIIGILFLALNPALQKNSSKKD